MDPRLLRHYNTELQHLREMGAEFARQYALQLGSLKHKPAEETGADKLQKVG